MGHVFKAHHSILGRVEAVKVLPKRKSSPESVQAFQREIRAQAQLDHPNLVRVSYAGQDGDTHFFVTEFVPGTDLRKLVRANGPLTMEHASAIISQAAQALDYAHARGLVHRDIKPGNLLVTPEGRTKVTDLGLAGYFGGQGEGADPTAGKIVGTADYLAPEAIRSPAEILPESDIYALGCTLYYAVTGKVPFPGGKTSEKLRRHCEEPPITPKRFNPGLSDSFLDVIGDMMEKDVRRRISSAAQVVDRLAQWIVSGVAAGPFASRDQSNSGAGSGPSLPPTGLDQLAGFQKTPSPYDDLQTASSGSGSFGSGSLSQVSEATDAVMSGAEETLPNRPLSPSESTNPQKTMSSWVLVSVVALTALTVLAVLGVWLG